MVDRSDLSRVRDQEKCRAKILERSAFLNAMIQISVQRSAPPTRLTVWHGQISRSFPELTNISRQSPGATTRCSANPPRTLYSAAKCSNTGLSATRLANLARSFRSPRRLTQNGRRIPRLPGLDPPHSRLLRAAYRDALRTSPQINVSALSVFLDEVLNVRDQTNHSRHLTFEINPQGKIWSRKSQKTETRKQKRRTWAAPFA
jgi:hypothetical protein